MGTPPVFTQDDQTIKKSWIQVQLHRTIDPIFLAPTLFIVVAIFWIGGGIYVQNQYDDSQKTELQSPEINIQGHTYPWTYYDEKYNFVLGLPAGFEDVETFEGVYSYGKAFEKNGVLIGISISKNEEVSNNEEALKETPSLKVWGIKNTVVDGSPATEVLSDTLRTSNGIPGCTLATYFSKNGVSHDIHSFNEDCNEVLGNYSEYKEIVSSYRQGEAPVTEGKFISKSLGITFTVPRMIDGGINPDLKAAQFGNKVYVFSYNPIYQESVEVFSKPPALSLEEAIRQIILKDYPSPTCRINILQSGNIYDLEEGYEPRPFYRGLITAEIDYPRQDSTAELMSPDEWDPSACNPDYAVRNGRAYFLYDPQYPGRFFFFVIGQQGSYTPEGIPWAETFEVLPL